MSFLESFLGGAAGAGAGILNQQMQDEQRMKAQEQLARLNEELFVQRNQTIKQLDREYNAKAGQDIYEGANKMKAERRAGIINAAQDPEIGQLTEEDKKTLEGATPDQLKELGIKENRAQDLDDQISVASRMGYNEQSKDLKGQQQIELNRAAQERMQESAFAKERNIEKDRELKEREQTRKEEQGAKALEIQQEKLTRALQSIGSRESGDSAKIKTANVYLDRVNSERKKQGMEPLTFEQAYKQSNYAEREDVGDKARQSIVSTLLKDDSSLAKKPEELKKRADAIEAVIGRNSATEAPKMEAPKVDKFQVGKQYRDSKGNTATYLGNGKWK